MYNRKDSYYLRAKKEGYKSRAAYKIMELNQKYKLIKKGSRVLDCGAAPGGWSQVVLEIVGKGGTVVAADYAEITGINDPNFIFVHGDMYKEDIISKIIELSKGGYDVVLSDMAPKTTGVKLKDHMDSIELVNLALSLAEKTLKKGGHFVAKLFDGEERENFVKIIKNKFKSVKIIRPDSTRKSSYEIYLVASEFKAE